MVFEHLVELYHITERRGGAVYKTVFVERKWVELDEKPPTDYQYVSVSTQWLEENDYPQTIRRKKD